MGKKIICLEGKSMTRPQGNTFLFRSSQQLPCLPQTLEGLFELTRHPSRQPLHTFGVFLDSVDSKFYINLWQNILQLSHGFLGKIQMVYLTKY